MVTIYYSFDQHQQVFVSSPESSLLLRKRRQTRGCRPRSSDVNDRQLPGPCPGLTNAGSVPPENNRVPQDQPGCNMAARNGRVARQAVQLLAADQKMKRVHPLPSRIRCGQIRSAVRQVFSSTLSTVQELSVKTAQKLELGECDFCEQRSARNLRKYKELRFTPAEPVDTAHLRRFVKALHRSIDVGWNRRKYPYIPNGHSTLGHSRREGGNWNEEPFAIHCRAALVFSSGKPRIVTAYASENSELLSPLHNSLWASLQGKDWLLVGSPTGEDVGGLDGTGPFVSVDYLQATNLIRAEYCRAAIQALIDKSDGLTPPEIEALRVVGELRFRPGGEAASIGQPMGSLMSFPLLCLINNAVVELSIEDAAITVFGAKAKGSLGKLRRHSRLINGDDLLFREFDSSHGTPIRDSIFRHGGEVGLKSNPDKCLVSATIAEINSTSFCNCVKEKKTNVKVLLRSSEVTDAIGFIADSVRSRRCFKKMLLLWSSAIAKQQRKLQGPIPKAFYSGLWCVKDALRAVPSVPPKSHNPFPVVERPALYKFTRGEEVASINLRVKGLRERGYCPGKPARCKISIVGAQSIQQALKKNKPVVEDLILKCLRDDWETLQYQKLSEGVSCPSSCTWAWDERSKVDLLVDAVRGYKNRQEHSECATQDAGPLPRGGDAISRGEDFIHL